MRTLFKMPLAATAALILLAALSACAPLPRDCSPQPDHFDSNRGFTRENYARVHPVTVVAAVIFTTVSTLTGRGVGCRG